MLSALAIGLLAADLWAAGPSAFTVEPDTVVLWAMNEGEGMKFADQAGGLALKVSSPEGKEPTWTEGKFGKALSFPGEVTLGTAGKSSVPDFSTGEVTVEAWIKPSEEGQGKQMGILQYSGAFRWIIGANGTLAWLVAADGQVNGEMGLTSKGKVPYGDWSHVAATYNGSVMRVFINGELAGEREFAGGTIQPTSSSNIIIGLIGSGERPYFIGDMNGIRISNKARSQFPAP